MSSCTSCEEALYFYFFFFQAEDGIRDIWRDWSSDVCSSDLVVENRPGATGEVGARAVIRSAPDGHTLLHGPISTWAINVALRPNLGYDPETQLTRITQTVRTPNVLVVNPRQVQAKDLTELVAWLKPPQTRASYSTSGIGSSDHLTMEMFKQATGTDIAHVPYPGGAPATTDLIAGTVQLSFQNLGSVAPRSEEHTSELQSRQYLVCRLLLEKKKK